MCDDAPVRLNKLLAHWGMASRRVVETWLRAGRISVNGVVLRDPGATARPRSDQITLDGQPLYAPATPPPRLVLMLHKPVGVTTTLADPHAARTLAAFLPSDRRLFPVGRLDRDSSGLLLLTDDGDLCHRLSHPKFEVEKEYLVTVGGRPLSSEERWQFQHGILLDDGMTAPCSLAPTNKESACRCYRVVLKEGRKRQIRRMLQALGHRVVTLHRVRLGPIRLGTLAVGTSRPLNQAELAALEAVG